MGYRAPLGPPAPLGSQATQVSTLWVHFAWCPVQDRWGAGLSWAGEGVVPEAGCPATYELFVSHLVVFAKLVTAERKSELMQLV